MINNYSTKLFSLKRFFLFLILVEFFNLSAVAAPGDTTWVTVYNLRKLTQYGNIDTTAVFPTGKRYRKIRMHYILGRYSCPQGTQYCGSWDYTTQIHARHAGMDSVEIARVITPYATDWLGQNKKHDYIIDVTDYAKALDGSTAMRFDYEGYSWGFNITLKFEMIEGVPPMDAVSAKNVYDGYFTYGAAPTATNYIENYLVAKPYTYSAPVNKVFVKNTVSGHGADVTGCGEFCSKYYNLKINNNVVAQKQLWRDNCGLNEVYPQTGTWVYDRGNWCPGAVVHPVYHNITSLTSANTSFSVDVDMQPYSTGNPTGGYNFVSQLISYSAPNHSLDVSIEDIIAPTKDDNYLRENPSCMNPMIKLKNVGTNSVTSVVFNYGLKGQPPMTYSWTTDSLMFLQETDVVFPVASTILSGTVSNVFEVSVVSVNGVTDQNQFNDKYVAQTPTVAIMPKDFIIRFLTNNSSSGGVNESSWTLFDETGSVYAYRDGLANATSYDDTLRDLPAGCYKLSIDDGGCDGLSWWANTAGGTGSLKFYRLTGANSLYTSPVDFGCNYTKYFTVPVMQYVGIQSNENHNANIEVFPNPASNLTYIKFDLDQSQSIKYSLLDVTGKLIQQKTLDKVTLQYETINTSDLNAGVYFISVEFEKNAAITKKLIIQK